MSAELIAICVALVLTLVPLFTIGIHLFQKVRDRTDMHCPANTAMVLYAAMFLPLYCFMLWVLCINIIEGISSGMHITDLLCRSNNCILYSYSCSDMSFCTSLDTCTQADLQRRAGSVCGGFPYVTSTDVSLAESINSYHCVEDEDSFCLASMSNRRRPTAPLQHCWCTHKGANYCYEWECLESPQLQEGALEVSKSTIPDQLSSSYKAKSCSCMTEGPTTSPTTPEPTNAPSLSPTLAPTARPTDPCLDDKLTCENYLECCSDLTSLPYNKKKICERVREAAQEYIFSNQPCLPTIAPSPAPYPTLITAAPSMLPPTPEVISYAEARTDHIEVKKNYTKSDKLCLEWTCTNTIVAAARSVVRPAWKQQEWQHFRCEQVNAEGTTCMVWTGNYESVKRFTFAKCLCLSESNGHCQTWECSEHAANYVFPNLIIAFGYPICFIMPVILFAFYELNDSSSVRVVLPKADIADEEQGGANGDKSHRVSPARDTKPSEEVRNTMRMLNFQAGQVAGQLTDIAKDLNKEVTKHSQPKAKHVHRVLISARRVRVILTLSSHGILFTILNVYIWYASGALGFMFSIAITIFTLIFAKLTHQFFVVH